MGFAVFVLKASTSCLAALHLLACAKNCMSATPLGEGKVAQVVRTYNSSRPQRVGADAKSCMCATPLAPTPAKGPNPR
jgi:hypothetical protein